jgi:tRNA (guanine37-N1)-methyltransferase
VIQFDCVTLFPEMFAGVADYGITRRALEEGRWSFATWNPRDFTTDNHRTVDDRPYGGGPGMVMKPEPFFRAMDAIRAGGGAPEAVILTTPDGRPFDHAAAERLSRMPHVAILCGRYEGVDDRVRQHLATEEISIGDYVLTGGELPALVVVDAVARLVPGVVGDEESVARDSFARGLLDYPQFTRPAQFRGADVPPVLLSGHHAEIERWRRREALRRTLRMRPELLERAALTDEERGMLDELRQENES